ncbi:hypothetical protein Syun_003883 [Stephania yunnanensis]|uniref:Uncharacterized protein n=1 Tax=Stephania yunnanensis TaxID=152371 RepID=A0AAP0L222_9MAGN
MSHLDPSNDQCETSNITLDEVKERTKSFNESIVNNDDNMDIVDNEEDNVDIGDDNRESNNEDDWDDSVDDSDVGIEAISLLEGSKGGMIFENINEVKASFKRHAKNKGFEYILDRWRKDFKCYYGHQKGISEFDCNASTFLNRYNAIISRCSHMVELGCTSVETFKLVLITIEDLEDKHVDMIDVDPPSKVEEASGCELGYTSGTDIGDATVLIDTMDWTGPVLSQDFFTQVQRMNY